MGTESLELLLEEDESVKDVRFGRIIPEEGSTNV